MRRLSFIPPVRWLVGLVAFALSDAGSVAADAAGAAPAASAVASTAPASKLPDVSWVPPLDDFDWIQLKSGEWLKGKLKGLQDRKLDFESEELNELTFDWKDIRQVRTAHTVDFMSVNGVKIQGTVSITPTEVVVLAGAAPQKFPREQLLSVTPGGSKESSYWSGKLSVGLTQRSGNTSQIDFNTQARLQRRTPNTRFSLDYLSNVSRTNEVESANDRRVNAEFNRRISPRSYLIIPSFEYFVDPFQNLDARYTLAVGWGYDLIAKPKVEWTVSASPGYQLSKYESVQPGEEAEKGAGAVVFSTRLDWEINKRFEWISEYRVQFSKKSVGQTAHHSVNTLSIDLTKRFELDVTFTWDRVQDPVENADGTEPKQDDFRLVLGLGVDF